MNIKSKIPEYVKTNRFIIKIFQIFCGLIVHYSIGCLQWDGLCFKEGSNIFKLNELLFIHKPGFKLYV
uniref:Uncharacterized protein n=1 Tax=Meloidogyne enterolobii TaxID=390850 RepID=A0A6V7UCA9_MELEN|nr:unnamed protein product [Meloidogyne enterolobii]